MLITCQPLSILFFFIHRTLLPNSYCALFRCFFWLEYLILLFPLVILQDYSGFHLGSVLWFSRFPCMVLVVPVVRFFWLSWMVHEVLSFASLVIMHGFLVANSRLYLRNSCGFLVSWLLCMVFVVPLGIKHGSFGSLCGSLGHQTQFLWFSLVSYIALVVLFVHSCCGSIGYREWCFGFSWLLCTVLNCGSLCSRAWFLWPWFSWLSCMFT